jgi:calcium-translocating P-type ATPase
MQHHTSDIPSTLRYLQTTGEGLNSEEAYKRLQRYGANTLPREKMCTLPEIFLLQFKSPIIYVLLIAAVAAFAIGEETDAYFILAVLLINALLGTYQEYSAALKAEGLKQAIRTMAKVVRDGKELVVDSVELTLGDVVLMESGAKVPADLRLIASKNLTVNESLLTGEALEVLKEADFIHSDAAVAVADRKNMVYAGTYVASGRARGVVTAVGLATEVGRIATLLSRAIEGKAPLIVRMERLSMTLAKAVGIVVAVLLAIGLFKGMELYGLFLFAVALAVSAIPEGLPVAITVALTSASLAMSRRNVIVRKLSAIEALGSCTLIASDKTGTLTKNQLAVEAFVPHDEARYDDALKHVTRLASVLCNEVTINHDAEEHTFVGDQVDVALAKHAITEDEACVFAARDYRKVDEIPYEPQNRYSAILVEKEGTAYEFVKGSAETVLAFCDLDGSEQQSVLEKVNEWAARGYRTIAMAYKRKTGEKIELSGFTYLGFMAIIDPVRDESREAVRRAKEAGIAVAMVTGDHPHTALHIARQLGIASSEEEVMAGHALKQWQEADPARIASTRVFARVTPAQKQDIVKVFQELGHFVAVTGDGVNDAPALRRANIGIAMGKSGTDIARSSGELILADDNFASIVNGIEEGRRAYDNIRKVVFLLVSTGFAEIVLVMLAFVTGLPLPLLPVQLLWLNLVTNGMQDVMLGLETAEPGVLQRRPRPPKERIFNPLMVRRVLVSGCYIGVVAFAIFIWLLQTGYSEFSARNITLLLMVLFENVHVLNSRTEFNYLHRMRYRNSIPLFAVVVMTQLLHIGCMYLPLTQGILSLEPVGAAAWLLLFGVALGLVAVMELDKWISGRYAARKAAISG